MISEIELKYHDWEVISVTYSDNNLKLIVRPHRNSSKRSVISLYEIVALEMSISGGLIALSRIEKDRITSDNIGSIQSFFRPDDQVRIQESKTSNIFVSIDSHVGIGLLSVCERISYDEL